ncbi:MAG: hypothetical protein ABI406_03760 [Ktedonobacteraceae bacterium]
MNAEDIEKYLSQLGQELLIPSIKTVQSIARAYQQICAGEEPWVALGNFRNAWYGYAKDYRVALVNDPLQEPVQNTEHTCRWAAFCAASVEFLCSRYGVPCPEWVHDPHYILTIPGGLNTPIRSPRGES